MACGTVFPKHFDYVFEYGGDPNLWHPMEHETPVFALIKGPAREKKRKLQRLIDLGMNLNANIDNEYTGGATPVMAAAGTFGQYDLALILLEAGADYTVYLTNSNIKLIHILARVESRVPRMSPQQRDHYNKLVNWLEARGESMSLAIADRERWGKWSREGKTELIDKEVAERKAREAREKRAGEGKQGSEAERQSWHQKFNWQAEEFFDDPQVIALCNAIEANDLDEIDRLVADGANANAKGKGNMTPLLWAFPESKPERFKKILEHGGDPNVIFESDFNTRMLGIVPGDSVTHMACGTVFPKYFDYVFEYGGDPNLWHPKEHETPVFELIEGPAKDKPRKLRRLIELGANLEANRDYEHTGGYTPTMRAAAAFGQYDLALILLEAGADHTAYLTNSNKRLIHILARVESRVPRMSQQQQDHYNKLVNWLEARDESLSLAIADMERWGKWSREGKRQLIKKEVVERKAREAREKAAAKKEARAEGHETDEPKTDD